MSLRIRGRDHRGERLFLQLLWDGPASHERDRTVVLEVRDPRGEVVDRAAKAVGRLTEGRLFEISVRLPRRQPARCVTRLEIHRPDAPPRVFEWPVELPDATPLLAATLSLSATTAAPGDRPKLTAHNTGPAPLSFGETYELQRWREDGTGWEYVGREDFDLAVLIELPPGGSRARWVNVPRRARPGRHRIVKEFFSGWARGTVRASVEFDIVAPGEPIAAGACGLVRCSSAAASRRSCLLSRDRDALPGRNRPASTAPRTADRTFGCHRVRRRST